MHVTVLRHQHTVTTDFHGLGNCAVHGAVQVLTDLEWLVALTSRSWGQWFQSCLSFGASCCGSPNGVFAEWAWVGIRSLRPAMKGLSGRECASR